MPKDILDQLWNESIYELEKESSQKELPERIYDYLKKDYPKNTLTWVTSGKWHKEKVKLSEIKMGRRPGGARETSKTEAIKTKYENGEKLDPVIVVKDGKGDHRLADGFHRTLAKKKAGFDDIDAYVMKTDKTEGPWLKEMHEKKLSKGIKHVGEAVSKKASYSVTGIDKEANPALLAGRIGAGLRGFGKNLGGGNARAAKKNMKDLRRNRTSTRSNNGMFPRTTFGKQQNDYANMKYQDARKNFKTERKKTRGARVGALGAVGVASSFAPSKNPTEEVSDFQQQRDDLEQRRKELENKL